MELTEFEAVAARIVEMSASHLYSRATAPVFRPMAPAERQRLLEQPLSETARDPIRLLRFLEEAVLPYPMGNGSPRFFGWVNSAPNTLAVAGEMLAAAMNPSCAGGDHAAIYLEHCVIRWLRELLGFPVEGSYGLLVSGGSLANLTAIAAARHWVFAREGVDLRATGLQGLGRSLVLYQSGQGHSCIRKAVELLGLGSNSIRMVPADSQLRIVPAELRRMIQEDKAADRLPFCAVASAGTVNTGAIDPLDEIASICEEEGLWFHIDGAYGAAGVLDPQVRSQYAGMNRADSLALDPHKWFSVPVECGCVLVKDAALLREAFSLVPPYLRTEPDKGFGGLPWFSEYGVQQTRGFRALKLWLTLASSGRQGLEALISKHNRLAKYLRDKIQAHASMELVAPGPLSVVCFRFVPKGDEAKLTNDACDALNKSIMETLQSRGECFVTSTVIGGRFCLRACILNYRTEESDLDALIGSVERAASEFQGRSTTRPG